MKKITLSIFAMMVCISSSFAQVTLENNNGDTMVTAANSVGCPPGDNHWGRNFFLGDFTVPANFTLTSGEIGVQSISADALVTVKVYSSVQNFDEGELVFLGSQDVIIPATATQPGMVSYVFDTPISIPAAAEAVFVEIESISDAYFIGGTVGNRAGSESYLLSAACSVTNWIAAADPALNFPDAHFYITVTGDTVVGVNDNLLSGVSVYPNPTTGILNVQTPSNVDVNSVALFDLLGKKVIADYSNGTINMSALSQGVYLLKVETTAGSLTQKIVKQ